MHLITFLEVKKCRTIFHPYNYFILVSKISETFDFILVAYVNSLAVAMEILVRKSHFPCVLVRASITAMKQKVGEERVYFIWLILPHHCSPLNEIRTGVQTGPGPGVKRC